MLPLTKQERLVIVFVSSVLFSGLALQYFYRRCDAIKHFADRINEEEFYPRVNLNRASAEELMNLPNVGERTALAIIEYRRQNGFFKSVEDVRWVKGIGPSRMQKLQKYLTVDR